MKRIFSSIVFLLILFHALAYSQLRYSTGCVSKYEGACLLGFPDLPLAVPEGAAFRSWYNLGGFQLLTAWENNNVWGSDFRDGANNDLEPSGGSDLPEIYFFSGHGTCQNPPNANSQDVIITCSNSGNDIPGQPGFVKNITGIGTRSRWGNGGGNLRFAFIDASCPMDLVSIRNQWFSPFQGLHMAVGFSGDVDHDALDSVDRGNLFAAYTSGALWLIPELSVGNAWMIAGIVDVEDGCCAVALAAGNDQADAINRREHERVKSNASDPIPNWFAWKWMCK